MSYIFVIIIIMVVLLLLIACLFGSKLYLKKKHEVHPNDKTHSEFGYDAIVRHSVVLQQEEMKHLRQSIFELKNDLHLEKSKRNSLIAPINEEQILEIVRRASQIIQPINSDITMRSNVNPTGVTNVNDPKLCSVTEIDDGEFV